MADIITAKSLFAKDEVKNKFQELIGKKSTGFITSVLQIVASNALLSEADPHSVYGAAATAATLDLPLNNQLGFAYIVPYNQKIGGVWKKVAQFQIGYKGLKQLALRTGQFKVMNATDVRKGEIKSQNRLTGEIEFQWIQDDDERDALPIIGYVSYFELQNGYFKQLYMPLKKVEKHAKRYSQSYAKGYGVWKDDFESMALKTVMKLNLSKDAPLSVEMQRAVILDQAVIKDTDAQDVTYPDNETITIPVDPVEERVKQFIEMAKTTDELKQVANDLTDATADLYTAKLDELNGKS